MMSNEVEEFNRELKDHHLQGQWELREELENDNIDDGLVPHVWYWDDVSQWLDKAVDVVSLEDQPQGSRRTILLNNPNHKHTSRTIATSIQRVEPGETAKAHRHNITAFRFVIDGSYSMYTVVEGERYPMESRDLILTPQMTWHDHVNESNEPSIWLDGLDAPLIGAIGAAQQENYEDERQSINKPDGYSDQMASMIRPFNGGPSADGQKTQPYRYRWADAKAVLNTAIQRGESYDPYNGVTVEYVNPESGRGPTLQTIALYLQHVNGGEQTQMHKHNITEIYHVVEGRGQTRVGDEYLEWGPKDCFVVPPDRWHAHRADEDSILFRISDEPVFESFGILYEEEKESDEVTWSEARGEGHVSA